MHLRRIFVPLLLISLALLMHFWIAPLANRLPGDYTSETRYAAQVRFRETPEADWQAFPLLARRVDQVLLVFGDIAIVQGESHWTTEDGTPTYEPIGLYGVDRRTGLNVAGFGDQNRSGQYLFPSHLEKKEYHFWDPYYVGPRTAVFARVDRVDGLAVFVFHYTAVELDDTAAYTFLSGVPDPYHTLTSGKGTLWIEPVSGIVVDFEDAGVAAFVDNTTGEHVADFYHWSARYTDETRNGQFILARAARRRILALETWLPLGLVLLAALWLPIGQLRRRNADGDNGSDDES